MSYYILWGIVVATFIAVLAIIYDLRFIRKFEDDKFFIKKFLEASKGSRKWINPEEGGWANWHLTILIKEALREYEVESVEDRILQVRNSIDRVFGSDGEKYIDELVSRINRKQIK